jgi:hypothetical protein
MQKLLSLSERLSKYLIAAVLVIVPLFPKFPFIRVPGTYVAIRFEDLLLLFLALALLPKIIINFKNLLHDEIITSLLIFLGVGFLALCAGCFLTQTVSMKLGILHWLRRIEYLIPFFMAILLTKREEIGENLQFYLKILIMVSVIAFIYGFGQRYFKFPVIITQNEQYSKGVALVWTPGSHINSTFAGHYDLAGFVVLVLPIFLTSLIILKDKVTKVFLLAASGCGLWLLISSVSRIAQVSYVFAVSVAFLLVKKFRVLVVVVVLSLVFMGMSSGLDARFRQAIEVIYQHINIGREESFLQKHFVAMADEISLPVTHVNVELPTPTPTPVLQDVSISIRLNIEWPRAVRAFVKNPLLGTGYSSIGLATDNDYLRLLGETGILGLAAFLLVFVRIGIVFIRVLPLNQKLSGMEQTFTAGIIGGLGGTLLTVFFIDLFEASKFAIIFWLLLGFALFLIRNKQYVK